MKMTLTPRRLAAALAALTLAAVTAGALPDRTHEEECHPVPEAQLERLESPTMQRSGGHMIVEQAAAFRGENEWFIAAEFNVGDAGGPMVGVWATQDLQVAKAPLFATEAYSRAFTVYPEAPLKGQAQSVLKAEECISHGVISL